MNSAFGYRPDIDGLRAIAVLAVIVYHLNSSWLPGGFVGVDVFFVISGFVVSASIVSIKAKDYWSFSAQFYARRLARIVPALVVVLCASALAATLFIPRAWLSELSHETALFAFWGLSNWRLQSNTDVYFAPRAELNPYTQTWSLGVEEQFYLIAPLLFFMWMQGQALERPQLRRYALILLGSLGLVSLIVCAWATSAHPALAFYSIAARFWELCAGSLLFFLSQKHLPNQVRSERLHALHGITPWLGVGLIGLASAFASSALFPWPWALVACLGTLLVIGGAHASPKHPIRKALASQALVWLGKRSYSLYLWHWPVLVLMRWTIGLENLGQYLLASALTLGLSMLSYRYIEQPIRNHRFIQHQGQSKLLVITSFVCALLLGFLITKVLFSYQDQISLSQVVRHQSDWYPSSLRVYANAKPNCTMVQSIEPFAGGTQRTLRPSECQSTPTAQHLYVLGDSHAGAIIPMLEELGAQYGFSMTVFSFQGKIATPYACGYLDLQAPMDVGRAPGCLAFNEAARHFVGKHSKPNDLVVLASLRMPRYGDQWASFGITNMKERLYGPEASSLRLRAAKETKDWVEPLVRNGATLIFMAPTPIFQAPVFRCADWFNQSNPICVGQNRQSRSVLEDLRAPIVSEMQVIAQTTPQVRIWDPMDALCGQTTCEAVRDQRPLFFDGDHLSNYGNFVLYGQWVTWLQGQGLIKTRPSP